MAACCSWFAICEVIFLNSVGFVWLNDFSSLNNWPGLDSVELSPDVLVTELLPLLLVVEDTLLTEFVCAASRSCHKLVEDIEWIVMFLSKMKIATEFPQSLLRRYCRSRVPLRSNRKGESCR